MNWRCPGDRHALLFSTRKFWRIMVAAICQVNVIEQFRSPFAGVSKAKDLHRDQNILIRGQARDKMKRLKNKADLLAAYLG